MAKPSVGLLALVSGMAFYNGISAQDASSDGPSSADLAKKLSNPVAALISVPVQNNWDFGIGAANAMRYTANIQPVIPFSLSEDWNLVTRTIVPVVYAESPTVGGPNRSGLGDVLQSFFLSPKEPIGGWILAAGPVALWPTASDRAIGTGKWGAGPTGLALRQSNGWTYGLLANHLWSYATADRFQNPSNADGSDGSGGAVNATFLQPFVSYTTASFTTFGLNTETTYDWKHRTWTVPLNASVSQLVKVGGAPVQFSLGMKYYADAPHGGPDWGVRFTVTFLFPKGK